MGKRGQAAMEFLMTYGWALLVLILIILALAVFGVLNPKGFLPEACMLGPGLACEQYKAINDGNPNNPDGRMIFMTVRNGMGKDLDIFVIYIHKENPASGSDTCGGIDGVIAFPGPRGDRIYNQYVPLFRDGTVRAIASPTNIQPGQVKGLNCRYDPASYSIANCCFQINGVLCYPPTDPIRNTCPICDPSYSCVTSSELFPNKGEKLSKDLVIVYRELGSSIVHQRMGKLTTKVE